MKQLWISLSSGILFGLGLGTSQMIDPARVIGFLDITGTWEPTLLFVLGGAVAVTAIAFRWILRQQRPFFSTHFTLPTGNDIDSPLVIGAIIFGIGWGISGYCPGPGLTALILGQWNAVLFVLSLIAGMLIYQVYVSIFQQNQQQKSQQ
ncbi:MAG: DUF6691 family protein [Cyanobacteria bacterium P01_D01_bin.36]